MLIGSEPDAGNMPRLSRAVDRSGRPRALGRSKKYEQLSQLGAKARLSAQLDALLADGSVAFTGFAIFELDLSAKSTVVVVVIDVALACNVLRVGRMVRLYSWHQ